MITRKSILFIVPLSLALSACSSVNLRLPAPLSRCETPLGTVAVAESRSNLQQYGLPSATALLTKVMEQSNCFTVNTGVGPQRQRGSVDWTITPSLSFENFNQESTSRLETVPLLGGIVNRTRGFLGGEEAAFLLAQALLVAAEGRTSREAGRGEGNAKRASLNLFGFSGLGPDFEAASGAYMQTEAGKIAALAFMQAHNRLVKALRPPIPRR